MLFNTSRVSNTDVDTFAEGLLLGYVTSSDDLLEASTIENLADKYIPVWTQLCNYAEEQKLSKEQRCRICSVFRGILHSIGYSSRVAQYLIDEFQARMLDKSLAGSMQLELSDIELSRMIDSLTIDFVLKHFGEYNEVKYEDAQPKKFTPLWGSFRTLLENRDINKDSVKKLAKAHHDSLIHLGFSGWKTKQLVLDCKKTVIGYKD
ncbi:MAG: hypothetical protein BMS9Abin11_1006 [Gammaproteobacteria bacterium]|nr:MAG: hypothetical protein BMS9Abin11_1006 [Gammaproteobacteria bacterium]